MDLIISSALEEICSQGQNGVAVHNLWSRLEPSFLASSLDLSNGVKSAVWKQLLSVSSLQFEADKVFYNAKDSAIQSFEDAEKLKVKVMAKEHLRDNFVGLYNVRSTNPNMSATQRRVLERLAIARKKGSTQSQLAKEFGIEGRNFHYVVKSLESQGLIVRQSAVVRTKEASLFGESRSNPIVSTNLMFLNRYAKHLGCQQKIEITKEKNYMERSRDLRENGAVEDDFPGKSIKEDVIVKDYLPKMKAICDKLEAASGKVLVVSDVKKDLGFTGSSSGHKAWRKVCNTLEKARIVEVFEAKVNNKFDCCVRLLKKLSPECFETNSLRGYDNFDDKHHMKFGRKYQATGQLVELAIEHQIYDMIDAAGFEGITVLEVCKRLGIDHKKNYSRLFNMFTRFGMHLQVETHNKSNLYRVWTHGNFNPELSNQYILKSKDFPTEIESSSNHVINVDDSTGLAQTFQHGCNSEDMNLVIYNATASTTEAGTTTAEVCDKSCGDGASSPGELCLPQESGLQTTSSVLGVELSSVNTIVETNISSSITSSPALLRPSISGSSQKYPCLALTVDGARREQKLLERLQDEKFILKAELNRWIVENEKYKNTTTDRKTIERIIIKLQREGRCKCIDINVPTVTNCGRTRVTQVVLHPSIQILSPQLLGEIHDKLRSFETQVRGHSSTKLKNNELLPILEGIQRTQKTIDSDIKAVRSEAMRANGFVMAKMIRAKLLHCFLWNYTCGSGGPIGSSSCDILVHDVENPLTSWRLFSLEDAVRSIPIELFLQVVGSTKKFDDMVDKCKRGLLLADLSPEEYKHLMDSNATGRLSLVIDILRRLKLVRLVPGSPDDVNNKVCATLKHAVELKPYIEEPVSKDATTSLMFNLDLRPRIRHDFVLSSRDVVSEYWQTLEYCYASADPRSARLAFPGSTVHEVFRFRSWASFRVMKAEQRAELLERIIRRDLSQKLTYKECEKIAKDLDLTFEQVLRVYYERRRRHLNNFEGKSDGKQSRKNSSRRKKLREERLKKRARHDVIGKQLDEPMLIPFPETSIESIDNGKQLISYSEEHVLLQKHDDDDDHLETESELGPNEEDVAHSVSNHFASSKMKPTRQQRFFWTDESDRQLIIQYVKNRAALGAKYHRTNWNSIPNLPGPEKSCMKRMTMLNGCIRFRKVVMRLCNILGKRYMKHLEKLENVLEPKDDHKLILRNKERNVDWNNGGNLKHKCEMDLQEEQWDDFDDKDVKIALEEVLRYKKIAIVEASKRNGSVHDDWLDANARAEDHESEFMASGSPQSTNSGGRHCNFSVKRSKSRRLHQKFMKILKGRHVSKEVYESLAISNAVELFKLVFLSISTAPEVPNLLAENLRRYSEHDLFSAFSYLRENKTIIGGDNGQPFILSQNFLHSISKSPFPANTGERASKFSKLLHERDKDLIEDGINLPADLQCGGIFHLFALVSSGDLSISPCLPDNGVGEPDDLRCSKRKAEKDYNLDDDWAKKQKYAPGDGEIISRREKGFPGIMVSVRRTTIAGMDAMNLPDSNVQSFGWSDSFHNTPTHNSISSGNMEKLYETDGAVPLLGNYSESPWETMAAFADRLMSTHCDKEQVIVISPEVFKLVYSAIQLAGDQGLSLEEVAEVAKLQGGELPQLIIDVLQTFQRVLKVNSFDDIRAVDVLYRSKYFLTPIAGSSQKHVSTPSVNMLGRSNHPENFDVGGSNLENPIPGGANSQKQNKLIHGDMHKVTILNLPPEVDNSKESKSSSSHECTSRDDAFLTKGRNDGESFRLSSGELNMPILPWINGDGTTNKIVYKGLRRRIFGIVMQNPGILEVDIIQHMDVLIPQSCKKLLELMVLDNHLKVKKMYQRTFSGYPSILGNTLLGRIKKESNLVCREHFFANPMSTSLL